MSWFTWLLVSLYFTRVLIALLDSAKLLKEMEPGSPLFRGIVSALILAGILHYYGGIF